MFLAIVGICLSMVIIWRACDGFEAATGFIGRNLSDGVRGATLNAIGSSLPELLSASLALFFYANLDGFAFGIGTTAGSAMFNSAVIPSLVIFTVIGIGLTTAVQVSKKVIYRDGIFLLISEFLLIFLLSTATLTWLHGAILISMYLVYISWLFGTMAKSGSKSEYDDVSEDNNRVKGLITINLRQFLLGSGSLSLKNSWALLGLSVLVIALACHILVESCYSIGRVLDINTYFVAVILAAAATSVPDTIISIKDAIAGEYDDAVANALGSNIFDICIGIGLPLTVYCLMTGNTISLGMNDSGNVAELRVLLLAITAVIFIVMALASSLKRKHAFSILCLYGIFVFYIIARANDAEFVKPIAVVLQNTLKFLGG